MITFIDIVQLDSIVISQQWDGSIKTLLWKLTLSPIFSPTFLRPDTSVIPKVL